VKISDVRPDVMLLQLLSVSTEFPMVVPRKMNHWSFAELVVFSSAEIPAVRRPADAYTEKLTFGGRTGSGGKLVVNVPPKTPVVFPMVIP
jgi:hypothetical protein